MARQGSLAYNFGSVPTGSPSKPFVHNTESGISVAHVGDSYCPKALGTTLLMVASRRIIIGERLVEGKSRRQLGLYPLYTHPQAHK